MLPCFSTWFSHSSGGVAILLKQMESFQNLFCCVNDSPAQHESPWGAARTCDLWYVTQVGMCTNLFFYSPLSFLLPVSLWHQPCHHLFTSLVSSTCSVVLSAQRLAAGSRAAACILLCSGFDWYQLRASLLCLLHLLGGLGQLTGETNDTCAASWLLLVQQQWHDPSLASHLGHKTGLCGYFGVAVTWHPDTQESFLPFTSFKKDITLKLKKSSWHIQKWSLNLHVRAYIYVRKALISKCWQKRFGTCAGWAIIYVFIGVKEISVHYVYLICSLSVSECLSQLDVTAVISVLSLCSAAESRDQRGGRGGWGAGRRPISSGLCPQEPGAGVSTGLHRSVQGTTRNSKANTLRAMHLLWMLFAHYLGHTNI